MRYELIVNSNKGVIIDPTPILRDIKDTFHVSFVLPDDGAYIAIFRGEDNQEHKAVIKDGAVLVPKELITKEQRVGVTVCLTDGEKILHSWECHPLAVGAFLKLRQTQWQLTAALSDEELYARIAEIERTHAKTLNELQALNTAYGEVKKGIETAAEERKTAAEREESYKEIIAENEKKLKKLQADTFALLRFAYSDYCKSVYLGGESVEGFCKEFGFDLTDEQKKILEGNKNED